MNSKLLISFAVMCLVVYVSGKTTEQTTTQQTTTQQTTTANTTTYVSCTEETANIDCADVICRTEGHLVECHELECHCHAEPECIDNQDCVELCGSGLTAATCNADGHCHGGSCIHT